MTFYEINYQLRKIKDILPISYENILINPGKGISYKESGEKENYNSKNPDFKLNYNLYN